MHLDNWTVILIIKHVKLIEVGPLIIKSRHNANKLYAYYNYLNSLEEKKKFPDILRIWVNTRDNKFNDYLMKVVEICYKQILEM